MRISPSLKNIRNDFNNNYTSIKQVYKEAKIDSLRKNYGTTKTAYNISKKCLTKACKEKGIEGIPIIAGIIGFLIPLPATSVILYAITKGTLTIIKPFIKKS